MEARALTIEQEVNASRKLGREQALSLLEAAGRVLVAKSGKLREFFPGQDDRETILEAMLGPTGNLRAPTLVVGDTIFVGWDAERYAEELASLT